MYDYLAHYGIKGQKWGVRNYQNEDGTLTLAGKAHYLHRDMQYKKKAKNLEKLARNTSGLDHHEQVRQEQSEKAKKDLATSAKAIGALFLAGRGTYHAIRASVASHKVKNIKNGAALEKYNREVKTMMRRYADTPYESLLKERVSNIGEHYNI